MTFSTGTRRGSGAETRYVELHYACRGAVRKMLTTIDLAFDPTTQLLSGPSGSGKTTELNRLRGELTDDGYRVAMFDIADCSVSSEGLQVEALGMSADVELRRRIEDLENGPQP